MLDTPESVQAFCKSQWSVDTDITGAAGGAVGAHLPATAANVSNMGLSDKSFTYSITKGAILDVSLTGGCRVLGGAVGGPALAAGRRLGVLGKECGGVRRPLAEYWRRGAACGAWQGRSGAKKTKGTDLSTSLPPSLGPLQA